MTRLAENASTGKGIWPSSTYMLAYDAKRDRLVRIYYQAALHQEFQVEFERMP